ncbi:MAG TPA: hypothetical protein VLB44_26550 [Kofleriaceae bacterium]|nr:hypothetical protein [Kofleriaceae bacterium]
MRAALAAIALAGCELPPAAPVPAPPPLAGLPLVVIDAEEITYQGQLVDTCESVNRDSFYKLDALYERLDAAHHKIVGFPFHQVEPVDLRVRVHYEPGCPLFKVRLAVNAITAAGYTIVLGT